MDDDRPHVLESDGNPPATHNPPPPVLSEGAFVSLFRAVTAGSNRHSGHLPGGMVDRWRAWVDACLAGYDDSLEEYTADLGARGSLEVVLNHPELQEYPEMGWVREQVAESDRRFRAMLRDDPIPQLAGWPWWESHPPRYAGPELAADFQASYGVHVDVRET
ncbi:hypothetical protein [Micromonospora sp. NPDC085948]|uniref:hypothetical protein n=1 Tax=Micromonospora sp. NPDC085948 TaxID=3155293 RepID=UPI00341CE4F4